MDRADTGTGRARGAAALTQAVVRAAAAADMPTVAEIYAHHVLDGVASFEIEPPTVAELVRRWNDVVGRGLPWGVAAIGLRVVGFAYAAPYRPRPAYRPTVENSVYVAPDALRLGIGRRLLSWLIDECARRGFRQMIAVIGDSGNAASIALHRRCGFEHAGLLRAVGFKHGRWLDSVLMQRALGAGDRTPPAAD